MSKRKLKSGGCVSRPKAFIGAAIGAAAGIASSIINANAQKRAARRAAAEQKHNALLAQANSMSQAALLSQNAQDAYEAQFRLPYKNGGRRHLRNAGGFSITDGGVAIPIGDDTFLLRGSSHNQINESGKTGIGIKVEDNKGREAIVEAQDGEAMKLDKNGARILATNYVEEMYNTGSFDLAYAEQEADKKNNNIPKNKIPMRRKLREGGVVTYWDAISENNKRRNRNVFERLWAEINGENIYDRTYSDYLGYQPNDNDLVTVRPTSGKTREVTWREARQMGYGVKDLDENGVLSGKYKQQRENLGDNNPDYTDAEIQAANFRPTNAVMPQWVGGGRGNAAQMAAARQATRKIAQQARQSMQRSTAKVQQKAIKQNAEARGQRIEPTNLKRGAYTPYEGAVVNPNRTSDINNIINWGRNNLEGTLDLKLPKRPRVSLANSQKGISTRDKYGLGLLAGSGTIYGLGAALGGEENNVNQSSLDNSLLDYYYPSDSTIVNPSDSLGLVADSLNMPVDSLGVPVDSLQNSVDSLSDYIDTLSAETGLTPIFNNDSTEIIGYRNTNGDTFTPEEVEEGLNNGSIPSRDSTAVRASASLPTFREMVNNAGTTVVENAVSGNNNRSNNSSRVSQQVSTPVNNNAVNPVNNDVMPNPNVNLNNDVQQLNQRYEFFDNQEYTPINYRNDEGYIIPRPYWQNQAAIYESQKVPRVHDMSDYLNGRKDNIDINNRLEDGNNLGMDLTIGDALNVGIGVLGSLASYAINRRSLSNMGDYAPAHPGFLQAGKLVTNYNINPTIANLERQRNQAYRTIDANTASSAAVNDRRNAINLNTTLAENQAYADKYNKEVELLNADTLNQQGITNQNVERLANWRNDRLDYNADLARQRALNNVGLVQGVGSSLSNMIQAGMDRFDNNQSLSAIIGMSERGTVEKALQAGLQLPQRILRNKYRMNRLAGDTANNMIIQPLLNKRSIKILNRERS